MLPSFSGFPIHPQGNPPRFWVEPGSIAWFQRKGVKFTPRGSGFGPGSGGLGQVLECVGSRPALCTASSALASVAVRSRWGSKPFPKQMEEKSVQRCWRGAWGRRSGRAVDETLELGRDQILTDDLATHARMRYVVTRKPTCYWKESKGV